MSDIVVRALAQWVAAHRPRFVSVGDHITTKHIGRKKIGTKQFSMVRALYIAELKCMVASSCRVRRTCGHVGCINPHHQFLIRQKPSRSVTFNSDAMCAESAEWDAETAASSAYMGTPLVYGAAS